MARQPALRRYRAPTGAAPARANADSGFTLVEVMAAMVVFVLISTATVVVVIQGLRTMRENSDRAVAANIARDEIEYLRSVGTAGITPGVTTVAHAASFDSDFKIRTTAAWIGFNQAADSCAASTPGKDYMRVTVQVTSSNISDPQTIDTIVTPPPNAASPSVGQLRVYVKDQLGLPVSDVVIAGVPPTTLMTGASGCVFVPNLTPASLALSISKSGYVTNTPTGLSQTATITASSLTEKNFLLAAGSSIRFAGANPDYPLPSTIPAMWQLNSTGSVAVKTTVGSVVTDKWPLTTGFVAWAGSCTDANPLTAYGVSPNSFSFIAGQTTLASLDTGLVKVRGLPKNAPVTAVYTGPDLACAQPSVLLGNANSLGILKVGLPYGSWTFSAGTEIHPLSTALRPPASGTSATPQVVNFTLACLDDPTPIPPGSPCGPTPTPTPTPTVSPSTPSIAPSP